MVYQGVKNLFVFIVSSLLIFIDERFILKLKDCLSGILLLFNEEITQLLIRLIFSLKSEIRVLLTKSREMAGINLLFSIKKF